MASASSSEGPGGAQMPSGPPYIPQAAMIGGVPTVDVDDPICAVLLVFYIAGAATNMTIFQVNRRRDHKFVFSAMVFGFCMARVATLTMRIVWASRPHDVGVAIAANILVAAGVLLLFIVNLIFSQRVLRARHPRLGWHRGTGWAFAFLYFCVGAMLAMVIAVTVQSFYTLDANTRRVDRDVQLVAVTFLAALAFAPLPLVALAFLLPRRARVEKFGSGRFRTKVGLLLFTATLLALGASFRAGTAYYLVPLRQPRWFDNKAAFYCFNFAIELIVVYTYTIARFDRRFHVPDGASGPGHYAAGAGGLVKASLAERVNREADVFGAAGRETDDSETRHVRESEWEGRARKQLEKESAGEVV